MRPREKMITLGNVATCRAPLGRSYLMTGESVARLFDTVARALATVVAATCASSQGMARGDGAATVFIGTGWQSRK